MKSVYEARIFHHILMYKRRKLVLNIVYMTR